MDCASVKAHLVAYQLGTLAGEERDAVEAHLVECRGSLERYLALKRAADRVSAELPSDRPRPEVRVRLREAVASAFPAPDSTFAVPTFARRIPLYQGIALAVLAAAVAFTAPSVLRRFGPAPKEAMPSVDSSRTRAESLRIY